MTDFASLLPWVFGLGVVAVLIGAYVLNRKRRERMMAFCLARGWRFVAEDRSLVGRYSGTPFDQGDHRRARNVIRGQSSGRDFVAFDYSFQTHSSDSNGRHTTTHNFAVCAVDLPAYLPTLDVRPEGVFSKLADAVGLTSDIDLESEDFNRAFKVRAADRKFATDVLSTRTMHYLLTAPAAAWRIEGTSMLRWKSGHLDPADIVVSTSVLDRVADGIPDFVWKDHQSQQGYDSQI